MRLMNRSKRPITARTNSFHSLDILIYFVKTVIDVGVLAAGEINKLFLSNLDFQKKSKMKNRVENSHELTVRIRKHKEKILLRDLER